MTFAYHEDAMNEIRKPSNRRIWFGIGIAVVCLVTPLLLKEVEKVREAAEWSH